MKNSIWTMLLIVTAAFITIMSFGISAIPAAENVGPIKIVATADKVHLAVDKNMVPYVRIIFQKKITVSGIKIDVDTMLMCFGNTYTAAKKLRPGQTFSVIASQSHYKGRVNYQALKFIK